MSDINGKFNQFLGQPETSFQPRSKFESAYGSFGKTDVPPFLGDIQTRKSLRQDFNPQEMHSSYDAPTHIPDDAAFPHQFSDNIESGRVFKNGSSLLKPVKAFDKYDMEAIHVDTDHIGGNVREINGRLYAQGENPIIEYSASEQIIQPNGHVTSRNKNHEADDLLNSLKSQQQQLQNQKPEEPALMQAMPLILLGSLGGAAIGAYNNNSKAIFASLGIAGLSLWAAIELSKQKNAKQDSDFRKKFEAN